MAFDPGMMSRWWQCSRGVRIVFYLFFRNLSSAVDCLSFLFHSSILTVVLIPVIIVVCTVTPSRSSPLSPPAPSLCLLLRVFLSSAPPFVTQVQPRGLWPPPNPTSWSSYSANSSRKETVSTRSENRLCTQQLRFHTVNERWVMDILYMQV